MNWIFLIMACCCEILWFYCIAYLNNFTFKALYTFSFVGSSHSFWVILSLVGYIVFGIVNMLLFAKAIQKIPPAIAFAVWTGLALVGISILDVVFKEIKLNYMQIASIILILIGIIGVKITGDKT